MFHNNPNIDNVVSLSAGQTRGVINTIQTGLFLRSKQIDYFYTLTDSFRSALIMWLSNSRYRIGYNTQNRSILLTNSLEISRATIHRSKKYLDLIDTSEVNLDERYIHLDDDEIKWAKEKMNKENINNPVALFPFSVASSRTFPKKKINEWLSKSSENFVIFGAESDRKHAKEIIQQNKNIKITSFCGDYELRKSIALISICKYAIAADSGLGHISSIIGIPTISFFGAGRSIETRPIGRRNVIIDKSELCSPCKKNICCLNSIKKSDVNYAIDSLHLDS